MIAEFKKLIASGAGPTLVQEIYDGAYNMTEAADDDDSLAESIVYYAEHETAAKSKVNYLESRLP